MAQSMGSIKAEQFYAFRKKNISTFKTSYGGVYMKMINSCSDTKNPTGL